MQPAQAIHLRLRMAEGHQRAERRDLEDLRIRRGGHAHIQPQLRAQIIRLHQSIFAHFRRTVSNARCRRQAEILRPQIRAVDHVKKFRRARDGHRPVLDAQRGGDFVTARFVDDEIRLQVRALDAELRGFQIEFAEHRHLRQFRDHKTVRRFHVERQPVRRRAEVDGLAGTIDDFYRHRQRLARQELILIHRHLHAHLRRRAGKNQRRQNECHGKSFHLMRTS